MIRISLHRNLPGPPELVWRLITDWEHQDDWMLEATEFELVGEQREGVGVEAKATIRIAGVTTRDRIRVTAWEPPRLLRIEHLGWVKGTGDLILSPTSEGTYLHWTESLFPPLGVLGHLGLGLLRPYMRRIFARDLRVLESLVRVAS